MSNQTSTVTRTADDSVDMKVYYVDNIGGTRESGGGTVTVYGTNGIAITKNLGRTYVGLDVSSLDSYNKFLMWDGSNVNWVSTMNFMANPRVVTNTPATVQPDDYIIWLDSEAAGVPQTLIFPDMDQASQTVIVRHLGGAYPGILQRGTNTYEINGDGASIAVDWLGVKTNWYWRQAY